jgi:Arc/MetJ family transcription regulator
VTKRLVDLDDDLLDAASAALHTNGISATVRSALEQAAAGPARAREIERLSDGD